MSVTRDKLTKQLEDVEQEKDRLRENLNRLEAEKKRDNFGKYEKEKMRADMDR